MKPSQRTGTNTAFAPFRYSSFTIGEEIGKGRFKRVCKGSLKLPDDGSERDVVILRYARGGERRELEILGYLARNPASHSFVPKIYGACEERPESLILQERAVLGTLKTAFAENSEIMEMFSPAHRVYAAAQVSRAMAFLESVRIVHADLSCRNCLLFQLEDDPSLTVVKVTDLGLAQVLPDGTREVVHKQPQAVRWCAPETIAHMKLSPRADAWSLGVTLWELLSEGANPWPNREKRAHVSLILRKLGEVGQGQEGVALAAEALAAAAPEAEPFMGLEHEFPQPEDCPQIVHEMVLACLRVAEDSSAGRPYRTTATELAKAFDRFIERCLRVDPPPDDAHGGPAASTAGYPMAQPLALKSRRLVLHNAAFACEESIKRITSNPTLVEFTDWAASRWDQLHEMFTKDGCDPSGAAFRDAGHRGQHGLSKERWSELLRIKGFKGNAEIVFDEVASEDIGASPSKGKAAGSSSASECTPLEAPMISLPQLKRFEARAIAANASLSAGEEGSAANRFAKQLKAQRGSVLRGWRLDIDLRSTGKVAFTDFSNACRKMGARDQARLVWDCLRKEGRAAPLEFHELAPEEADNLEDFAQAVLNTHGFNLELAWNGMDDSHQNYLTLQDFAAGAQKMGFTGDAKQIYRGLDASGLGRMLRDDFFYLSKVSNKVPYGRQAPSGPLADLITFVKKESVNVDEFIAKLGVAPCQTEIAVNDLGARLTAIGFEGDALYVASRVARSTGGTRVTIEALRVLLSGERGRDFGDTGSTIASLATPVPTRIRPPPQVKEAWNSSVDNISDQNLRRCHSSRSYFGNNSRR